MSTPYQLSLLRRTLAAFAAATLAFTAADAMAQGKVKLSNAGGKDECAYSSMSITPDGSVTVQCSGTTPPPPPGQVISISPSSLDVAKNSVGTLSIKRTNGTSGAYLVFFQLTGSGCALAQPQPALVELVNNGPSSVNFGVAVGESGNCEVRLVLLTPSSGPATIWAGQEVAMLTASSVVTPPPPPPPPPTNCPVGYSLPPNLLDASFAGLGNPLLQMQASGQVVAIPLPAMQSSGQVTFGESAGGAYTPQPVTLEVSISKCKGLIDTDYSNRCNIRSTNGNYNSITWLAKPYQGRGGTINQDNASANGLCWGGGTDPYYINARWAYSSCAFGVQVCGFAIQYNLGGY